MSAAALDLTPEHVADLTAASDSVTVQGDRYPESMQRPWSTGPEEAWPNARWCELCDIRSLIEPDVTQSRIGMTEHKRAVST